MTEKEKYETLWTRGDYSSRSAIPYADTLMGEKYFKGLILEVGCGDGRTANKLIMAGYDVIPTDITLKGFKYAIPGAIECPVWELPFPNGIFDVTYSTDVLEHVPPNRIRTALVELRRVSKPDAWHFHQVATFPMGDEHLTVLDIIMWNKLFMQYLSNFKLYQRQL
jgi:SAM-dependent methyltransferase